MSNEELIKALRCCADDSTGCGECPFVGKCTHAYYMDLKLAAADAIQTLCDELATYHAKSVIDNKRIAELESWAIHLLKQLPKEGEWIEVRDWLQIPQEERGTYRCSACGQVMKYPWNYCPNCGARMKTVTDCHTLNER